MTISSEQEHIEAIGAQLRAKIGSKFTASTFLAGFALTVLTGQVFTVWQTNPLPLLFAPAVGAVFGALILFVAGIVRLDELTMPKRFWREDPKAVSPVLGPLGGCYLTGDDLWELHNRMVFCWYRLTLVATLITGAAVMAMLIPMWERAPAIVRAWTVWCSLAGVAAAAVYVWRLTVRAEAIFNPLIRPVD